MPYQLYIEANGSHSFARSTKTEDVCNFVDQFLFYLKTKTRLLENLELTDQLVEPSWRELAVSCGLTRSGYSTERVLLKTSSAERSIVDPICSDQKPVLSSATSSVQVEILSENPAMEYKRKNGVSFYSAEELTSGTIMQCLRDAFILLDRVPRVATAVGMLVRSLHVIKPESDACDLSFSEPHIPFSIFASVPSKRLENDSMRVAEGIVHEAMHLHLTLIERVTPLVTQSHRRYYSPWRKEHRSAQGILHALYVFRAIDEFLGAVIDGERIPSESYIRNRRHEIATQVANMYSFLDSPDLTYVGRCLIQRILQPEVAYLNGCSSEAI